MKFAPVTVKEKAAEPAVTEVGDTEVTDGSGFKDTGGGVVVPFPPPQAVRNGNSRQSKLTIAYERTSLSMSASESTVSSRYKDYGSE